MKNPLREICTAGSVRGEIPSEPWWPYSGTKLETADTAKESLQLLGLLYSEVKHARKVVGITFVAGGHAPEVLQPGK